MTSTVEYLNPAGAPPAQGLYSHIGKARGAGDLLFVAGQLSVAPDGSVAGAGDFATQFKQIFHNLGTVLAGVGCGFEDVIKFTTYLVNPDDLDQFMELRQELFPTLFNGGPYPPNTLLMINRLVKKSSCSKWKPS